MTERLGVTPARTWPLALAGAFAAIYSRSLVLRYVEGDDAASIAYHALGRHPEVQPPYSVYHSGMDLALSLLPASEPVLRGFSIGLTAVAAWFALWQVLSLAFAWAEASSSAVFGAETDVLEIPYKPVLAVVLLLAMPEIAMLGLVYTPSMIGFALVLAAHRWLRMCWEGAPFSFARAGLAGCLFGVGVACRFDLVLYAAIIVLDIVLLAGRPDGALFDFRSQALLGRVKSVVAFGAGAAVGGFGTLVLAGYGVRELKSVLAFTRAVAERPEPMAPYLVRFAALSQTLFTPGLAVLLMVGAVLLRGRARWFVVINSALLGAVILLLRWPVPKLFLVFLPGIVFAAVIGWMGLCRVARGGAQQALRQAFTMALLVPWVVGVWIPNPGSSWGPGYRLQGWNSKTVEGIGEAGPVALRLAGGSAIPTPEGPRPLWGFGWVLLGGEQRRLTMDRDAGRRRAVAAALDADLPLLLLQGAPGLVIAELLRNDLVTVDGPGGVAPVEGPRKFGPRLVDGGCDPCDEVSLFKLQGSVAEWAADPTRVRQVAQLIGSNRVVALGYSSNFRAVAGVAPEALVALGPESAFLDLAALTQAR